MFIFLSLIFRVQVSMVHYALRQEEYLYVLPYSKKIISQLRWG